MHRASSIEHTKQRAFVAICVLALGACASAKPVDLGHDDPTPLGSALSDYEGTWEGYAEAYQWDDGTDTVRLELGPDGTGVLEVGDAAPLPPPDPTRGYPPSVTSFYEGVPESLASGYTYPVTDGAVEDNRLRMRSNSDDLWREWCELMTPHLTENTMPAYYACLPIAGWGEDPTTGTCVTGINSDIPIDCGLPRCLTQCECTEQSCGLSTQLERQNVLIDATLEGDGDEFEGTLVLGADANVQSLGTRVTIRLTRL
jgi:hypothetical protein